MCILNLVGDNNTLQIIQKKCRFYFRTICMNWFSSSHEPVIFCIVNQRNLSFFLTHPGNTHGLYFARNQSNIHTFKHIQHNVDFKTSIFISVQKDTLHLSCENICTWTICQYILFASPAELCCNNKFPLKKIPTLKEPHFVTTDGTNYLVHIRITTFTRSQLNFDLFS